MDKDKKFLPGTTKLLEGKFVWEKKKLSEEKIWQRLINMMNALDSSMIAAMIDGIRYTVYKREGTALRMEKTKKKVNA